MTASDAPGALWLAIRRVAMVVGLLQAAQAIAAADPARFIAAIYPDIGEPYRSVFMKIVEGIEAQTGTRVAHFPVGASVNAQELGAELRRQDIRAVIVLGRNGLKAAAALDRAVGVIAGGVLSVPESQARGLSVHSLAPDPALLFARLKGLLPGTKRVFVGALFSLYPNNVELGRSLASAALGYVTTGTHAVGVTPLREVLVAVNVRTANHLGIDLGARQQSFDMVFPEP